MKLALATFYLLLLSAYIASHFISVPAVAVDVRDYAEKLLLYFYLLSLAILSVSELVNRLWPQEKKTTSQLISENFKAHVYVTRVIVFAVLIGFPTFIYFNWSRGWELSDAVIVAVPTILLAIVIAEQNIYNYSTRRLERIGLEQARISAIFQIVDTMAKNPNRQGLPGKEDLDELEDRLAQWEKQTAEANFAKFAAQSRNTLRVLRRNHATTVWEEFLQLLHRDLRSYIETFN